MLKKKNKIEKGGELVMFCEERVIGWRNVVGNRLKNQDNFNVQNE